MSLQGCRGRGAETGLTLDRETWNVVDVALAAALFWLVYRGERGK